MLKKLKIFWVTKDDEYQEILDEDYDYEEEGYEEVEEDENEEAKGQIALDILDNGNEMIILAPVAGVDIKDIDVSFFNQVLTISGVRKKPDIYSEWVFVKNSECYWGRFERKIILPENLDFEDIHANIDNNLLIVKIPKLRFSSHNIKIDRLN